MMTNDAEQTEKPTERTSARMGDGNTGPLVYDVTPEALRAMRGDDDDRPQVQVSTEDLSC